LPDTIGNLAALETLDLCDCCSLVALPDSVCQLTQLDEGSRACVRRRVEAVGACMFAREMRAHARAPTARACTHSMRARESVCYWPPPPPPR
jgi:hypothetical protein